VSVANGAPTPPNACPSGWTCADVGGATPAGTQSLNGSTWTVQGGGADIWGTSDQFRYVWQPVAADATVTARVASQGATDAWAKAGVMLRQTATDAGSMEYAMLVTPASGVLVQYRSSSGAGTALLAQNPGAAPAYVRVARSGSTFTAYTSSDGLTWTPVAGSSVSLPVSGAMAAGIAVSSHNTGALSAAALDGVGVTNSAPPPPGPCPTAWSCVDVGGATPAGAQTLSSGTWTVRGGGGDIWGTADQFHLVSQPLAGDGSVSARLTAQGNTDPWAKAGVMLRQSTDAGSAYYAIEVTPGNGLVVQYRTSTGVAAAMAATITGGVPVAVRVTRSGATFSAFTSFDGVKWVPVAGSSVTLSVSGPMLGGLAVTSHNTGTLSTTTFTGVTVG
jgi:hypothetical protein